MRPARRPGLCRRRACLQRTLRLPAAACGRASAARLRTRPGGTLPRGSFRAKSDYVTRPLSGAARATLVQAIERRAGQTGSGAILFDAHGGAINRVAPHTTAFAHRNALYCVQYLAYGGGAPWLTQTHAAMRSQVSGMAYQNYIDPELARWQHAYYGRNYPHPPAVRRRVDPDHRFNFPPAIGR